MSDIAATSDEIMLNVEAGKMRKSFTELKAVPPQKQLTRLVDAKLLTRRAVRIKLASYVFLVRTQNALILASRY
jgi:hypothetical protein